MIVYLSWVKQVIIFLQILADSAPIAESGTTRVTQSWELARDWSRLEIGCLGHAESTIT